MAKHSQLGGSLVKQLACCNKSTREKSLSVLLKSWLPSQSNTLPVEDVKKLWKGLFYCVWHSDKSLVQSELIDRLSSLLLILHLPFSIQYFSTFLLTMRREWSGIDGLRLDKFYLLIRRFLSKFFSLMKKNSWDLELVNCLMGVLNDNTFSAKDKLLQGNGVNYHVASVFVEELRPFLPLGLNVLEVIFRPFIDVMGKVNDRVLVWKIKSGVFDVVLKMGKRLLEVKKSGVEVDSADEVVVLGTIAIVMGFSGKFFEMGSSPDCVQGNRKVLFELHEEFLKLEKDVAASGFDFSVPDIVVDQNEEKEPILDHVANGVEVGEVEDAEVVANATRLKKCKKVKKDSVDIAKKSKKKNKKSPAVDDKESIAREDVENSNDEQVNDESTIQLNEDAISNLQKQFEIVASEAGLEDGVASACDAPQTKPVSQKRKRTKNLKGKASPVSGSNGGDALDSAVAKSGEKSAKKVRFAMKNNLVWKPQSPLPPQSLRLPPSATPRGSALKKGVPAGPIREMLPATKKPKLKKARKAIIGLAPAVKRLRKLKSQSS
ncbi:hypothetical protein Lal_00040514 [Lupinus albus]|uniref:Putative nucleolar, Nop52 n=1 Tax=Lupinus albus TaxID=3870 RepID=A0A6A4PJD0_LUPAL|nr:putative nucleolar, Nop52 [Lupinus albus]KAF1887460.1 hypothetical protein Lal_00040514 [Lupinus albus]